MDYSNDYYKQREISSLEKIERLEEDMPPMTKEFVLGITEYTSPLTRLNYVYDLRIFFDFLVKTKFKKKVALDLNLGDLEELDITDFENYLAYLTKYDFMGKCEMCSERAKSRKLATVRAFFKYFFNKGKLTKNVAAKIATPKKHEKEIIRLEGGEVHNLIAAAMSGDTLNDRQKAYHENTRIRDVAILTLFLGTGIRNSELVGLNIDDVNFDSMSFAVTRKGGNRTILYFNDEVKDALENWLAYRATIKEVKKEEKALFLSLQNRRISTRTIQELVKKYAKTVTPLKKITPHKLRSTFGTNLYRETNDIYLVADFLGHADVNTTKKHYAAMSENLRKEAVKSVKLSDGKDEE